MGGDGSLTVIHCTPQRSFTLTLYSLDVATVNLSVSFPRFMKGTREGLSRPAVSTGYARLPIAAPAQRRALITPT